jgi:hypothetical protein
MAKIFDKTEPVEIVDAYKKIYTPEQYRDDKRSVEYFADGWIAAKQDDKTRCPECQYFDEDKKVYTTDCYNCRRYHADLFTPREGK